jgi:hypothetical protein
MPGCGGTGLFLGQGLLLKWTLACCRRTVRFVFIGRGSRRRIIYYHPAFRVRSLTTCIKHADEFNLRTHVKSSRELRPAAYDVLQGQALKGLVDCKPK